MSVAGLPRLMLRRWYATLSGLVILAVLVVGAIILVPVKYQASSHLVILPPQTSGPNGTHNPYLELGGLDGITDVLSRSMQDPKTVAELQRAGMTGTFSVGQDPAASGSLILVSATSKTAQDALTSRNLITNTLAPKLLALQQAINVPAAYQLTIRTISTDEDASVLRKSQIRAVLVAAVIGLVVTILLAVGAERLAVRRRRKRAARREAQEQRERERAAAAQARRAKEKATDPAKAESAQRQPERTDPVRSSRDEEPDLEPPDGDEPDSDEHPDRAPDLQPTARGAPRLAHERLPAPRGHD